MNFRRHLNDWEIENFCHLLLQLGSTHINQSQKDLLVWTTSKDMKFSVNNCYNLPRKRTSQWETNWPWKVIWRNKPPVKVACFGWTAAWEACLTQNNLQRGFSLGNRCYLCEEEVETVNHLLLHCRFARQCSEFPFSICGSHGSCLRVLALYWGAGSIKGQIKL